MRDPPHVARFTLFPLHSPRRARSVNEESGTGPRNEWEEIRKEPKNPNIENYWKILEIIEILGVLWPHPIHIPLLTTPGGRGGAGEKKGMWKGWKGKEVTRLSEGTEEMSERRSLPWPGSAGRDGEGPWWDGRMTARSSLLSLRPPPGAGEWTEWAVPTEEARRATGPRFTRGTRKRAGPCPCRPEACTEGPKHSEGSEVRRPVPSLRPTSETVRRWREQELKYNIIKSLYREIIPVPVTVTLTVLVTLTVPVTVLVPVPYPCSCYCTSLCPCSCYCYLYPFYCYCSLSLFLLLSLFLSLSLSLIPCLFLCPCYCYCYYISVTVPYISVTVSVPVTLLYPCLCTCSCPFYCYCYLIPVSVTFTFPYTITYTSLSCRSSLRFLTSVSRIGAYCH